MAKLNSRQEQAIRHDTGPLLILAGAGTGKTRVVTERMARMLREGVRPRDILGVTFTNKAAGEMRRRLAGLVGRRAKLSELILSTFHSLCVRIIRRDAGLIGYTPDFSICDQGEQLAIVRKAAATVGGAASLRLEEALSRIGSMKNRGLTPEECRRNAVEEEEHVHSSVYRRYQETLRRQNCMDFDDLLLETLRLFRNHPGALDHWRDRFRHIMVDEFQDTNQVQFELVRLLAAPRNNLCVVGDDDQSIYAWRGAMAGNILRFAEVYPGAVTVRLEQNYRSTSTILSAANAVIANNAGRREKTLWSDLGAGRLIRVNVHNDQFEEAAGIASGIRDRMAEGAGTIRYDQFAVIVRANAQARPIEDELLASRIPYRVVGGQSLFDRKEARDILSYLSVIANPGADNQLLRIINVPARGIGDRTIDALSAHAARNRVPLSGLVARPETVEGVGKQAAEACRKLAAQFDGWRAGIARGECAGLVRAILDETGYEEELRHLYRDPLDMASRWNQALEVGEAFAAFAERNGREGAGPGDRLGLLSDFLRDALLVGRDEEPKGKGPDNAVLIITAHSAKGLEFPFVFIPGLEEELFPHRNAIETDAVDEERRLFYVAMTRARLELTLSRCRARTLRGKESGREPSRFLDEIPAQYLEQAEAPTRQDETLRWVAEMRAKMNGKE